MQIWRAEKSQMMMMYSIVAAQEVRKKHLAKPRRARRFKLIYDKTLPSAENLYRVQFNVILVYPSRDCIASIFVQNGSFARLKSRGACALVRRVHLPSIGSMYVPKRNACDSVELFMGGAHRFLGTSWPWKWRNEMEIAWDVRALNLLHFI